MCFCLYVYTLSLYNKYRPDQLSFFSILCPRFDVLVSSSFPIFLFSSSFALDGKSTRSKKRKASFCSMSDASTTETVVESLEPKVSAHFWLKRLWCLSNKSTTRDRLLVAVEHWTPDVPKGCFGTETLFGDKLLRINVGYFSSAVPCYDDSPARV